MFSVKMMNKLILVFVVCFVGVQSISEEFIEDFLNQVQPVAQRCMEETNAGEDDLGALISHETPPTHEGKCMLFCIYKHFNLQKEDGTANKIGALKSLDPLRKEDPEAYRKFVRLFVHCGRSVVPNPDPCIFATELGKCAFENAQEMGLGDVMQF
ncbi:general odorant-binding protein 19d-like [Aethina tumida]|uniref:general odorant-binding protein 19d-like n=1 Tax=Aethina tumida TaxID=116153 RepID=UPI002149726E|nr:general odorant-binding protein 19d-like [Aethina tumida]